ncbi:GNAT family N-acetyltransferase [Streptococcus saliviloxodontae]|uniref:RimJ/RimL family protein N-acetyltransferase n=1 Tax=Streptococcus saliviloxodontae TaxID=1349416 RepID=A0ABS2PM45_9STRE|nr:GNAT family protein [Streptococcus saliviloxodontae]MBM7636070.1 RimJ/RimL family protein N-acetyltransferase [Streptococcus saliviloxodontae]
MVVNVYGQEIGESLLGYTSGAMPDVSVLEGNYCRLEHIDAKKHLDDVADFYWKQVDPSDWTYMYGQPFTSKEAVRTCLEEYQVSENPYFFAIREKYSGKVLGTFSLMRIDPHNRVVEMGRVIYAPALQKTRAATEAQYLVMKYVFEELSYRRYEWKCDRFNKPSAQAAQRLGFRYEGTFRQHTVYKGRTRDTDWFSIIDSEWPSLKLAFENWLSPENFDKDGQQKQSLKAFRVQ